MICRIVWLQVWLQRLVAGGDGGGAASSDEEEVRILSDTAASGAPSLSAYTNMCAEL